MRFSESDGPMACAARMSTRMGRYWLNILVCNLAKCAGNPVLLFLRRQCVDTYALGAKRCMRMLHTRLLSDNVFGQPSQIIRVDNRITSWRFRRSLPEIGSVALAGIRVSWGSRSVSLTGGPRFNQSQSKRPLARTDALRRTLQAQARW